MDTLGVYSNLIEGTSRLARYTEISSEGPGYTEQVPNSTPVERHPSYKRPFSNSILKAILGDLKDVSVYLVIFKWRTVSKCKWLASASYHE